MKRFRIYICSIGYDCGHTYGYYDDIHSALKAFDDLVNKGKIESFILQQIDLKYGWVSIKGHTTYNFERRSKFEKQRERENEPDWHAGDCKYNSPGYHHYDFI